MMRSSALPVSLFSLVVSFWAVVSLSMVEAEPASSIVVTYHPQATQAGEDILAAGGNAFDAFVAATLAEYVVAEGGTSIAGPLGALIFDAKGQEVAYLEADFNEVKDPKGQWSTWDGLLTWLGFDRTGKAVLVPGALAGLEEMSRRYGKLHFEQVVQPALKLARDGFPLSEFYAAVLQWSAKVLRRTDYGRRTFFRDGQPLRAGDTLTQPELAEFLGKIAKQGAAHMYRGEWARKEVRLVQSKGGRMTEEDLASYHPSWHKPWQIRYRGYDLHTPSGRDWGGLWVDLALLALENTRLADMGHYSNSADALEVVVRTARQVWQELPWLEDPRVLEDRAAVESRLTTRYTKEIWDRVHQKLPVRTTARSGSHSYHIIVADEHGNVVTGTHTIQSLPWGDGVFVEGIPLTQMGYVPAKSGPGERRVDALTMHLGFRDGQFRLATGAITATLLETDLQFLLNLIDYGLPPAMAASLPRFGTFPHDLRGKFDLNSNWLDPDIPEEVVRQLESRQLSFVRKGPQVCTGLDTGLGAVMAVQPDGSLAGATAPWPGLTVPWRPCAEPLERTD
jgi:gamma-glutamyltranspeptidase / glutathione hydrolase